MILSILLLFITLASANWLDAPANATWSAMKLNRTLLTEREVLRLRAVEKIWKEKVLARQGLSRRNCEPDVYSSSTLVGNGNPHQNFYFQQVTGDINWAGAGTSISYSTSTATTWSVSVSGQFSFITGGFSVSETYTQGSSETVACSATDNQICIFQKVAYTAYTVQPLTCVSGCGEYHCENNGNPVVFYSPNSNQFGGCYIKGTNNRVGCANEIESCTGAQTGFWKYCGPAGGPPSSIYCPVFETKECGVNCT